MGINKDIEDMFSNEKFLMDLGTKIGEKYSIDDLLDLLNLYKVGGEREWISKVDELLEEIEVLEEFSEYIVEMEKLREFIRTYLCVVILIPKVLCIGRATIAYLLEVLKYAGFTRLNNIIQLEKEERETGKQDMFLTVYDRILSTVSYVALKIVSGDIKGVICGSVVLAPLRWSETEEKDLDDLGKPRLDKQAWIEFNEYLEKRGDVFGIPESSGGGTCELI